MYEGYQEGECKQMKQEWLKTNCRDIQGSVLLSLVGCDENLDFYSKCNWILNLADNMIIPKLLKDYSSCFV